MDITNHANSPDAAGLLRVTTVAVGIGNNLQPPSAVVVDVGGIAQLDAGFSVLVDGAREDIRSGRGVGHELEGAVTTGLHEVLVGLAGVMLISKLALGDDVIFDSFLVLEVEPVVGFVHHAIKHHNVALQKTHSLVR